MPRPYAIIPPCTSKLVSEESAQKGTKDLCGESCIPCTAVAERILKREDPLTYGNDWNHMVDEMRGGLCHPPSLRTRDRIHAPCTRRPRADRVRTRRSRRARIHERAHRTRGTPGSHAPRTEQRAHPAPAPEPERARSARGVASINRVSRDCFAIVQHPEMPYPFCVLASTWPERSRS
jgi:hypothetical protein